MQKILSYLRRAVDDYEMIQPNDRVAVGISGGKDSLTLLAAMARFKQFYPVPFELEAITINMGIDGMDFSKVSEYCKSLGVRYTIVDTDIANVIFNVRKESNPCSLCAKMRRGALHQAAKDLGCTRVALGHHNDDVIETFFLSLFYEGRLHCFSPVTYLDRTKLYLIRPFLYLPEHKVRQYVNRENLPVVKSLCPADKNTKRQVVKDRLADLYRVDYGLKQRLFTAIQSSGIDGFTPKNPRPLPPL